jgi:hypothetical protein
MLFRHPTMMHIEVLEHPKADVIAREDASDGEFYLRQDGTVWYRNGLAPGDDRFANSSRSEFQCAVEALHRYNADVAKTEREEEQLVFVQRLAEDLRAVGALSGPEESFWPLIVEQAQHGMA